MKKFICRREKGIASIFMLLGMLVVAVSLPVATKLVQQNQENRSKAALVEDAVVVKPTIVRQIVTPTVRSAPVVRPTGTLEGDSKVVPTVRLKVCAAGAYRCDGNNLMVCRSDGSGWSLSRRCDVDQTCNAVAKTCETRLVKVDGKCSATLNTCLLGTFRDEVDTTYDFRWKCVGKNGGISVVCMAARPTIAPTAAPTTGSVTVPTCNYVYGVWGNCINGTQTRTETKTPSVCTGGTRQNTSRSCAAVEPTPILTCVYGGKTYALGKSMCQGIVPAECLSGGTWRMFSPCAYGCTGEGVCKPDPIIKIEEIILDPPRSYTLNLGNLLSIGVSFKPQNPSNKNIVWSSSNSSVAIVNSAGVVRALRPGIANITASAKDGSGKKTTINIHVPETRVVLCNGEYTVGAKKCMDGDVKICSTTTLSNGVNTVTWELFRKCDGFGCEQYTDRDAGCKSGFKLPTCASKGGICITDKSLCKGNLFGSNDVSDCGEGFCCVGDSFANQCVKDGFKCANKCVANELDKGKLGCPGDQVCCQGQGCGKSNGGSFASVPMVDLCLGGYMPNWSDRSGVDGDFNWNCRNEECHAINIRSKNLPSCCGSANGKGYGDNVRELDSGIYQLCKRGSTLENYQKKWIGTVDELFGWTWTCRSSDSPAVCKTDTNCEAYHLNPCCRSGIVSLMPDETDLCRSGCQLEGNPNYIEDGKVTFSCSPKPGSANAKYFVRQTCGVRVYKDCSLKNSVWGSWAKKDLLKSQEAVCVKGYEGGFLGIFGRKEVGVLMKCDDGKLSVFRCASVCESNVKCK